MTHQRTRLQHRPRTTPDAPATPPLPLRPLINLKVVARQHRQRITNLFIPPERSPVAQNPGRVPDQSAIKQFPGEMHQHS